MGWVVQMSSIGLSAAVICILGLTTVHSVASIVVAWGASTTRLILIIVVARGSGDRNDHYRGSRAAGARETLEGPD